MRYWVLIVSALPAKGMALFPFILLKKKDYRHHPVLMNHEKIHLAQQLELFILPFYLLYFIHYLFNLLRFRNHDEAYRQIVFEREAYQNDDNLNYLSTRKIYAWFNKF